MQADRKKLGILIIVLGLIIIFLIVYFIFIKKNTLSPAGTGTSTPEVTGQLSLESAVGSTTPSDAPRSHQTYDISKEPVHKITADDLGKIAMAFATRLGSYSNQSNYSNFTDLEVYGVTNNFTAWADKYVVSLKSQPQNQNVYYGITTKATNYEIKNFDGASGQAEILVTTQRKESTDKINGGTPYIQTLDLVLVKINGDWLFDKAAWGK
jgi:hypothetical protein